MALRAFDEQAKPPRAGDLERTLRGAEAHWDGLIAFLATEYAPLEETWNFAGANWGWSLRLKQKKRTVLYMTPCKGLFLVGFALGEKAVKAAHDSPLPDSILAVIDEAKKYAEGRAVRIEIKNKKRGLLGYTPIGLVATTAGNLAGVRLRLVDAELQGEFADSASGELINVFAVEEIGSFDDKKGMSWEDVRLTLLDAATRAIAEQMKE